MLALVPRGVSLFALVSRWIYREELSSIFFFFSMSADVHILIFRGTRQDRKNTDAGGTATIAGNGKDAVSTSYIEK